MLSFLLASDCISYNGAGVVMKFSLLTFFLVATFSVAFGQSARPPKLKDAKNVPLKIAAPPKDPALANYYINFKTSPRASEADPVETSLPLKLEKGDRICLVGNLLLDAERRYGHLETLIHQALPEHELSVRNLAWPGDEVDLMPRPDNFGDLDQHLTYFKADVIIAAFGYNESFAGREKLTDFKERLNQFLSRLKSQAYNGESAPRVVLISPTLNSDHGGTVAAHATWVNLERYTKAMEQVATSQEVGFVDVRGANPWTNYDAHSATAFPRTSESCTIDGHALNENGHLGFSKVVLQALLGEEPKRIDEQLRKLVIDKATQFFYRYRPLNTFYYTGGRNKAYGYLDFLPAMRNFDLMVKNRDKAIHATSKSGRLVEPDDSNLPKLDEVLLARGANKFLSPADELKAFKIDPRFEVGCFASEEDFPEMACPIAMRWDHRGRLWVSTSVTYPHVYPGQKPCDKIIILEDTDQDGKADKCTTWAEDLHIPLSFVLDGNGGVYCSEQPHLTHLTDQDGDGRMDHREVVLTGFGCEDSHHSLHDFTWTPGGDLLFRESIFHNSQIETAYGPVRAKNSSWFLYKPATRKLIAFGAYPNTNPWGVVFDQWGNHVASHPVFASTFHATNPDYPAQHPRVGKEFQAYSGTCGHDFVSHTFWPKEMQGGFVKARYKPTNRIEFHKWIEKEDHFAEDYQFDLIFSTNLSFIPVDLNFGPDGACYVCDWYNPVKGHAQYSLRDPRRDREAGRIWRIIPKVGKVAKAPKIANATVAELFEHLKSPHYRTRYRARLELRGRASIPSSHFDNVMPPRDQILKDLPTWTAKQDDPLALLESLWLHQELDLSNPALLEKLINCGDHLVAASAFGPLRFMDIPPAEQARLLKLGAQHPSQHVRREAVICASYLQGGSQVIEAISPVLDQPAGSHLAYAIKTAFNSATLKPHWSDDTEKKLARLGKVAGPVEVKLTKEQRRFDRQKDLIEIKLGTIPERLLYTQDKFTVKAGQPVKLVFSNPDATEHNLLILEKGSSVEEIGMAANEMAKSPEGAKKHYIPDDKRILHATKLLKVGTTEILRFKAPVKPGSYPFVCTYPGHWTIMKGVMTVE